MLVRPLTFTLQCCLPWQALPPLSVSALRLLRSLAPVLPPARFAAAQAAAQAYFAHWTVRLAQLRLFAALVFRQNWATDLGVRAEYLQHRTPVRSGAGRGVGGGASVRHHWVGGGQEPREATMRGDAKGRKKWW